MMGPIQIIGLLCGCFALFFALVTAITYFKLKKFFTLISEEQFEQAEPIIEKQRRRIFAYTILSSIFTVLTIVFSFVANI